jgi:hypothetical protein
MFMHIIEAIRIRNSSLSFDWADWLPTGEDRQLSQQVADAEGFANPEDIAE